MVPEKQAQPARAASAFLGAPATATLRPVRFQIEAPRSALIAMQRRYPRADGWSTWWMDLDVACRWLRATYEQGYDGPCLLEGEHEDRQPVATRLISELLDGA